MFLLAENEQSVQDGRGHSGHGTLHADASSGQKCNFSHSAVPSDPQGGRHHCTKYTKSITIAI